MAKLSYTPREAAAEVGVSEETIRAAIRAGDLETLDIRVNGRKIKKQIVSDAALREWLQIGVTS